jgi:hypothetical protein
LGFIGEKGNFDVPHNHKALLGEHVNYNVIQYNNIPQKRMRSTIEFDIYETACKSPQQKMPDERSINST